MTATSSNSHSPSLSKENKSASGIVVLTDAEQARAKELAQSVDLVTPDSIINFGREISQKSSHLTDELLQRIRSNDKDIIGDRLNEVVQLARDTHTQMAFQPKSWKQRTLHSAQHLPVIGPVVRRVAKKVQNIHDGYQSAAHQIDTVILELDQSVQALQQTNAVFNSMYDEVTEQIRQLEIHVEAGYISIQNAQQRLQEMQTNGIQSDIDAQKIQDLQAAIAAMEKRVADLRVLQQSALQTLPNLRMIQANNIQLIEKFHTIQDVTIPAWKQGFVIRGALTQQQNAVRLTQAIDETTNSLLLENSRLLHTNSVQTAQANQRLVIDVATLQKTSDAMYQTAQEVLRIRREGKSAHETALRQLEALQKRTSSLAAPSSQNPPAIH